jgi:hypothetical protein
VSSSETTIKQHIPKLIQNFYNSLIPCIALFPRRAQVIAHPTTYLQQALAIRLDVLGEPHPHTQKTLRLIAIVSAKLTAPESDPPDRPPAVPPDL